VITYWDYLKIHDLLSLQSGLEGDGQQASPDELHFIIVHQVFELWFKLILSEVRRARDQLVGVSAPSYAMPAVLASLSRVNRTLAAAVGHWDVMETMSPQDFLLFRDKLFPASGFQSFQFPEIEIVLGLEETIAASTGETRSLSHIERTDAQSEGGAKARAIISRARGEPTFRHALYGWLAEKSTFARLSAARIDAAVESFGAAYLDATANYFKRQVEQLLQSPGSSRSAIESRFADNYRLAERFIRATNVPEVDQSRQRRARASILYIETYIDLPDLAVERQLIEAVLELESLLLLWRTRHARMAEKMIGRRVGTGGASVDYLDHSLTLRVFPDLWEARTQVVPRHIAPPPRWTNGTEA
jgi:tryptophan 2,3-dioxygenase